MQDQPSGPLSDSVLQLVRLVRESTTFQRMTETFNPTDAERHVYVFDYEDDPEELASHRPYAVVWPAGAFRLEKVCGGSQNYLRPLGELILAVADNDRVPYWRGAFSPERRQSGLKFLELVDGLIGDIEAKAGKSDYLPIDEIRLLRGPEHSLTQESADAYWEVWLLVSWKR